MRFIIYRLGPLVIGLCAAWVTFVVVACSYVVVRLYHALEPASAAAPHPKSPGGRPPLILPGRLT